CPVLGTYLGVKLNKSNSFSGYRMLQIGRFFFQTDSFRTNWRRRCKTPASRNFKKTKKARKYDEKYLEYGFKQTSEREDAQPQCVVCGKVLAKESLKLSKLLHHLQAKHSTLQSKPSFFKRKLQKLRGQKLVLQKATTVNQRALFVISHWIAKTVKLHTLEKCCRPASINTNDTVANRIATCEQIFVLLDTYVHDINWNKCVGICPDGARAMNGKHSGLVTKVQAVAPLALWTHCMIHRQALAAKRMPADLKLVMDEAVCAVNSIKTSATSGRLFKILCQEMGSEHHQLLYHSEVRWLSRGNVLSRLYELRDEVRAFLLEKGSPLAAKFSKEKWLAQLAYLADVFNGVKCSNTGLSLEAEESLIDLATDTALKQRFSERSLPDFWISLLTDFPEDAAYTYYAAIKYM
uniref:BED-type domain-containing protein n=1 Tax=Astyanax mexicanus TaxID=7994 RepID=A0A8B9HXP2_ASTMX